MKKITFLTFLLVSFLSFGQTTLYDFESGELPQFQFNSLGFGNIPNPDPVGNTSANVLEINKPDTSEWFGGIGFETPGLPLINFANGTEFTMDVWAPFAGQSIRFQVQNGLSGEPTYNRDVVITNAMEWVTLTFDFGDQPGLTGTEQYPILVIQPNYDPACEGAMPECTTVGTGNGGLWYIDNIIQIADTPPTCNDGIQNGMETGVDCGGPDCPPCPPSCTDGIQNGMETGVDCGGPDCPPCPPDDPTDGPGNASSTGTDFIIYGEDGSNGNSDFMNFNLVDFSGAGMVFTEPDLNGDTVLKVENLNFFGSGLGESFNATGTYSFVHLNYYATTSTAFNFSLVDDSLANVDGICCGNPQEPFFRFGTDAPLQTGQWVSIFIPLSHYANFPDLVAGTWDGTDIIQTLVTGNGTVYFDNIFFSTTDTLGNEDFATTEFKVFPNPTKNNWTIVSNNVVTKVQVYDILGKSVLTVNPNLAVSDIDASSLNKGVYFANITTEAGTSTMKLVKN